MSTWTEYYSDLCNSEISKDDAVLNVCYNNNSDQPFTGCEIGDAVKSLRKRKSHDIDNILT